MVAEAPNDLWGVDVEVDVEVGGHDDVVHVHSECHVILKTQILATSYY